MVKSSGLRHRLRPGPGHVDRSGSVYVEPVVTEPVAYWSEQTGWIDATEYRSASFDLALPAPYQAALRDRQADAGN